MPDTVSFQVQRSMGTIYVIQVNDNLVVNQTTSDPCEWKSSKCLTILG